MKIAYLSLKNR